MEVLGAKHTEIPAHGAVSCAAAAAGDKVGVVDGWVRREGDQSIEVGW